MPTGSAPRRHTDIDVRLDLLDHLVDVAHGEAGLGICCGPGNWKRLHASKLMDETVVSVAGAALALGGIDDLNAWMAGQTLIHDAMPYAGRHADLGAVVRAGRRRFATSAWAPH